LIDDRKGVDMVENYTPEKDQTNLLDYVAIVVKRRGLILVCTAVFMLGALGLSLLMTNKYEGRAAILPPQQGASLGSQLLAQAAGGLASLAGLLGAAPGNPSDLYVGLVQARTVEDRIIDRFDLLKTYPGVVRRFLHWDTRDDVRDMLEKAYKADADPKSGIITITVEDQDPRRAAAMANAFVEEVKNLTQTLSISEASQRRLFFEEQMKGTKGALVKAEEELKGFGERTGALQIDQQAKAVIEGIAALMAQIAATEVQIKVIRTYATPGNPDLKMAEESLRGMKAELAKMEAKGHGGHDPLMPTGRIPSVATDFVRKLRDFKFNEDLFVLIAKQYELARLDEARDAAVIQVVDRAVVPERKSRPNRILITALGACLGVVVSVSLAFVLEFTHRAAADAHSKEKIDVIRDGIRGLAFWKMRRA
jgi:uncharacterized protein involved in exopolysaccharide biosynthesis